MRWIYKGITSELIEEAIGNYVEQSIDIKFMGIEVSLSLGTNLSKEEIISSDFLIQRKIDNLIEVFRGRIGGALLIWHKKPCGGD